jgi:hypothetical protein
MCDACKSYENQSKDLDSLLDKHIHHGPKKSDTSDDFLSDDIKKRIMTELKEKK